MLLNGKNTLSHALFHKAALFLRKRECVTLQVAESELAEFDALIARAKFPGRNKEDCVSEMIRLHGHGIRAYCLSDPKWTDGLKLTLIR